MDAWELALSAAKWLIYLGQAAATGGILMLVAIGLRRPHRAALMPAARRPLLIAGGTGVVAAVASFFLQTGAFAEAGPGGMFDRDLLGFLWDSPVGTATLMRAFGMLLPLAGLCLVMLPGATAGRVLIVAGFCLPGLLLTGWSFTVVGHVVELGGAYRALLALHVVLALCWAGALYPLWLACGSFSPQPLRKVMHDFGSLALWLVPLLLGAGITLLWALLDTPGELFVTPYGLALTLKIALVLAVLLLAALHRWFLVPGLVDDRTGRQLRRSIAGEALLVVLVLLLTAPLSSILGPA